MADVTKKTVIEAGAEAPVVRRRASPMHFFQSKITWPSWKETWLTTVMVFIMVALTMVFFFFVDSILAYGERLLIGAA